MLKHVNMLSFITNLLRTTSPFVPQEAKHPTEEHQGGGNWYTFATDFPISRPTLVTGRKTVVTEVEQLQIEARHLSELLPQGGPSEVADPFIGEEAEQPLPQTSIDYPVGGRLHHFRVSCGLCWKFISSLPKVPVKMSGKILPLELQKLLKQYKNIGKVERTYRKPRFISKVKAVAKQTGGHRLVISLHRLNRHIHKVNYRLPTTQKL